MAVSYTGMVGNCYKNIWTDISAIAADCNTFSMKVTNNGTKAVRVRIDIESQTQMTANTTCCNKSATQDGSDVFTDLEWGGSAFVVQPGTTAVLKVVYNETKLPTNLKIFVDSHQWDDPTTHDGSIVISEMEFVYDAGEAPKFPIWSDVPFLPIIPGTPSQPDTPSQPEAPAEPISPDLAFNVDDNRYTIESENKVINVKYNGPGTGWKPVTAEIASCANDGRDTLTFIVTNNGDSESHVRFDVQGTTKVGNTDACNVSATATVISNVTYSVRAVAGDSLEVYTDLEWADLL